MRVAYLLDRPELGGGVKVVFQHAALLAAAGHQVWVAGRGARPDWAGDGLAPGVTYLDLETAGAADGSSSHLPESPLLPETLDLVVATYWTTLAAARAATRSPGEDSADADSASSAPPRARAAAQLLQGYEPDWPHQRGNGGEIEAAYRAAALPALVVASHLGETVERRHGVPWHLAPPPVDPRFSPSPVRGFLARLRASPRRHPWVVIPGIFEAEVKGVRVALEAVRRLGEDGLPCRLARISVLPQTDEERSLLAADRFLAAVPPTRVAAELRAADLVLFPAQPGEGFGLPLLEAMASGVPAVASRLPSTEEMTAGRVPLVAPDDPAAFASAARPLLTDSAAWLRAREEGLEAAAPYLPENLAPCLEAAVGWAVATDGGQGR